MSPLVTAALGASLRFPRVSGDEPHWCNRRARTRAFSPRERG